MRCDLAGSDGTRVFSVAYLVKRPGIFRAFYTGTAMLNEEIRFQRYCAPTTLEGSEDAIQKRLEILALAHELQNVSQACRRAGISRSRFYELKGAFDKHGAAGLAPQPRTKPRMPNQTPVELIEPILSMTARYPTYSYIRISAKLRACDCEVLPSTVRAVWEQRGLTSCKERIQWLKDTAGSLPARYARLLRKLAEPKIAQPTEPGMTSAPGLNRSEFENEQSEQFAELV